MSFSNNDDDENPFNFSIQGGGAGVTVTPTSGLITTEAGGTANFTVVLVSQPSADVTIGLTSSDTTEGTVPANITFTPANWNAAQTVTVTGVDDLVDDGNIAYSIVTTATSADAGYNGIPVADVALSNINDAPLTGIIGLPVSSHYQEGQQPNQPASLWPDLAFQDRDGGLIQRATVTIQGFIRKDWLLVDPLVTTPTLLAVYDPIHGVLTLSGYADQAVYQQVLRTVQFFTTKDITGPEQRQFLLTVTDAYGNQISGQTQMTLSPSVIIGLPTADTLDGSYASDLLQGLGGNDRLNGLQGNDRLEGGPGNDLLKGDVGNDSLFGGTGNDVLLGGPGNDRLSGGAGNDRLDGGAGNDRLQGDSGDDLMQGGDGNDLFSGDPSGDDRHHGGAGRDTLDYGAATGDVTVSLALAVAQDVGGGGGLDLLTEIENLSGSTFNDRLTGNAADNRLNGGLGNDRLSGGAGPDRFVFNTAPGIDNVDVLADYNPAEDRIELSAAVFTAFAAQIGQTVGLGAHLDYNPGTGVLSYLGDGIEPPVSLAIVGDTEHPAELVGTFVVIGK